MAAKLPAIPDPKALGKGLLLDILTAIKSNIETRLLGIHGDAEKVVLQSQLGASDNALRVVTDVRLKDGALQKKTKTLKISSGIITAIGNESDWA